MVDVVFLECCVPSLIISTRSFPRMHPVWKKLTSYYLLWNWNEHAMLLSAAAVVAAVILGA